MILILIRQDEAIQVQIKKTNPNKEELLKYIIQKKDGSTLYITR